jgi:hypothetical protein
MSSGSGQVIPACLAISRYFPTVTWEMSPPTRFFRSFHPCSNACSGASELLAHKLESGHHLIALDGSQYFSSEKIHCPSCLIDPVLAPDPAGCDAQSSHAPSLTPGPGICGQYRRHHQTGLRDQCGETDRRQNPPDSSKAQNSHYRRRALLKTALYRYVEGEPDVLYSGGQTHRSQVAVPMGR